MSLADILQHIQQAGEELSQIVEQEQPKPQVMPTMYTFAYEQLIDGAWRPSYMHSRACNIEEAFHGLGHIIQMEQLHVRGICYGTYLEMEKSVQEIDSYWRKYYEEKNESSVAYDPTTKQIVKVNPQ